jgi:hypothetical protein
MNGLKHLSGRIYEYERTTEGRRLHAVFFAHTPEQAEAAAQAIEGVAIGLEVNPERPEKKAS